MSRIASFEDMPPVMKGRSLDPVAPTAERGNKAVFDAVLYPNRSLPNAGFVAVMTVIVGVYAVLSVFAYVIGAWPVVGFCGVDAFLVWLAFRLSYRQGRLHERVLVTPEDMWVSRVLPSGHEMRWRLQPFWTRVEFDRPARHESQLCVTSKGRTLVLGAFLSPPEWDEFAKALQHALQKMRG